MILNAVTGNFGKTIMFFEGSPAEDTSTPDEVDAAVDAMRGGEIDVVFIAGANPVFTMPPSARIAEALQKVPFVVWAGGVPDETAAMASLLLPAHHPLESWRDTAPRAGVRGLGQPVMQPVFDSKPVGDILLAAAGEIVERETSVDGHRGGRQGRMARAGSQSGQRESGRFLDQRPARRRIVRGTASLGAQARHVSLQSRRCRPRRRWNFPSMPIRIFFFTTGAARTSRGCRNCRSRSRKSCGTAGPRFIPRRRASSASRKDDVIEIKTEHGAIEAPVLVESTCVPA